MALLAAILAGLVLAASTAWAEQAADRGRQAVVRLASHHHHHGSHFGQGRHGHYSRHAPPPSLRYPAADCYRRYPLQGRFYPGSIPRHHTSYPGSIFYY
jgi:hypothetical protein